jgi:hypothetical protein
VILEGHRDCSLSFRWPTIACGYRTGNWAWSLSCRVASPGGFCCRARVVEPGCPGEPRGAVPQGSVTKSSPYVVCQDRAGCHRPRHCHLRQGRGAQAHALHPPLQSDPQTGQVEILRPRPSNHYHFGRCGPLGRRSPKTEDADPRDLARRFGRGTRGTARVPRATVPELPALRGGSASPTGESVADFPTGARIAGPRGFC